MSAKRTSKQFRKSEEPRRGRANLARLRKATERTIRRTSPPELANLPADFLAAASIVRPTPKQVKKARRARLERAGWKVGSVREFLALTDEEASFIELKLALASELRRKRERAGLTQAALARLIESSQSRVAKIEAGDRSVTLDLIVRSLLVMGTSRRELGRIISATKKAA